MSEAIVGSGTRGCNALTGANTRLQIRGSNRFVASGTLVSGHVQCGRIPVAFDGRKDNDEALTSMGSGKPKVAVANRNVVILAVLNLRRSYMRLRFTSRIGQAAKFTTIAVILLILLAVSSTSSAQTAVTGGLNGVVTDSTGAVVPGATVTIVNTATGDTRVLTTNAAGRYTAPFLKPGAYTVSASAQGLQSSTTSAQILSASNPLPISPFRRQGANRQ